MSENTENIVAPSAEEIIAINSPIQEVDLQEKLEAGYHLPPELTSLHKTNMEHLDYGRLSRSARKYKSNLKRLNILNFSFLSATERIQGINKHDVWVEKPENLQDRNYSAFGAYFYKAMKDSISVSPISSNDTFMNLHSDPLVNAEMMSALYVYANDLVVRAFEESTIVNSADAILFCRKLKEEGLVLPILYGADLKHALAIDKVMDDSYYDIDILGSMGRAEPIENKIGQAKEFMIDTFPQYQDELSKISNYHFNTLIRSQLGTSFCNKLKRLGPVIENATRKEEEYGWEQLIKPDFIETDLQKTSIAEVDLLKELQANFTHVTNIRHLGAGANTVLVENEKTLHNKNLKQADRTGYDWLNTSQLNINDNEPTILAEEIANTFGIDGIQWGASVNGLKERTEWLQLIGESLKDLAFSLKITPSSIGLPMPNGNSLGIAIGTSGVRNSRAHYKTNEHYLHMNREKSTGSFAHEWFHAYDSYLFQKAVKQEIIPNSILNTLIKDGGSFHYTSCLYQVLKKGNKNKPEIAKAYQDMKEFDPALMNMYETIYSKTPVVLKEQSANDFANDIDNYHDFDGMMWRFDRDFAYSIKLEYYQMVKGLTDMVQILNFNDSNVDELNEIANSSTHIMDFISYSAYINALIPNDEKYKDVLFQKNDDGSLKSIDVKKLADEEFRTELYQNLTKTLEQIRTKDFSQDNLNTLKENLENCVIGQLKNSINKFENPSLGIKEAITNYLPKNKDENPNINEIRTKMLQEFNSNINTISSDYKKAIGKEFINQVMPNDNFSNFACNIGKRSFANAYTNQIGNIKSTLVNSLTQNIHQVIVENNLPLDIGIRTSNLYQSSLNADGIKPGMDVSRQSYYTLPQEMFARIGETVVAEILNENNFRNLFLSSANDKKYVTMSDNGSIYPEGNELSQFKNDVIASFALHFPVFDLDLNNIPIIENEYQMKDVENEELTQKKKSLSIK